MKHTVKTLAISIGVAASSLFVYNQYFQKTETKIISSAPIAAPVYVGNSEAVVKAEKMTDFTIAAEQTVNAVVHVANTQTVQAQPQSLYDLFQGNFERRKAQVGTGSGVIISPDGYIVTNNHVIDGAEELLITLNNRKKYPAKVIGTDKANDIALLKIEAEEDLSFITFGDSDTVKVGEWVLAVGNPYNLNSTVTAGIISAKARDLEERDNVSQSFLQTDAAVNPGNSGGALVNTRGELIGINTAITSPTGSYSGYSFAVPSNITKRIVEDLMENGSVQRAWLGISGGSVQDGEGVQVSEVTPKSGAAKGGLKKGDVIKKIDNVKINKFSDLTGKLNSKRPGDVIMVEIDRDGKELMKKVTLTNKIDLSFEYFGAKFKELSEAEKKQFGIESGVKITEVGKGVFKDNDIEEGSVLLGINQYKISGVKDLSVMSKAIGDETQRIKYFFIMDKDGEKWRISNR